MSGYEYSEIYGWISHCSLERNNKKAFRRSLWKGGLYGGTGCKMLVWNITDIGIQKQHL